MLERRDAITNEVLEPITFVLVYSTVVFISIYKITHRLSWHRCENLQILSQSTPSVNTFRNALIPAAQPPWRLNIIQDGREVTVHPDNTHLRLNISLLSTAQHAVQPFAQLLQKCSDVCQRGHGGASSIKVHIRMHWTCNQGVLSDSNQIMVAYWSVYGDFSATR